MFDLSGYTPETPVEGGGFEPIQGKDIATKVNKSDISKVPSGTRQDNGEAYEAYNKLSYELEVIDGKFKGRKAWKNVNLDNATPNAKGKTPVQKLADNFSTLGLEFNSLEELRIANEKFKTMKFSASYASFKGNNGKDVSMVTFKGPLAADWAEGDKTPTETAPF